MTKPSSAISFVLLFFVLTSPLLLEKEVDLLSIGLMPPEKRIVVLKNLENKNEGNIDTTLLLSKSYIETKRFKEAQSLLEKIEKFENSPLYDYYLYFLIVAKTSQNPNSFPLDLYLKLYSVKDFPSFKVKSLNKISDYYLKIKDYNKAIPYLRELLIYNDNDPETISKLTKCLIETKDFETAFSYAKNLYINFPLNTSLLNLIKDYPFFFERMKNLSLEERIKRLYKLEEVGGYFSLEKEFGEVKNFLKEDEKIFFFASILLSKNAIEGQKRLLSIPPDSPLYKTALLRASSNLKSFTKYTLEIERLVTSLSDCDEKRKVLNNLFLLYKKNNLEKNCLRVAYKLITHSNEDASEYLYRKAYEKLLEGKKKECFLLLKKMTEYLPKENDYYQSALFSLIKLKALNEKEEKKAKDELLLLSKYGYFGYRLRNGGMPNSESSFQNLPPFLSSNIYQGRVFKSSLLLNSGLVEEALNELEEGLKENESNELLYLLALTASKTEKFPKSVRAIRKIYQNAYTKEGDKIPLSIWQMLYPTPYIETFKKVAKENGISIYELYSIGRQESLFDKKAVSRSNALGIVQLLPSTAKIVAKKYSLSISSNDDLFDIELNLTLGSKYYKDLKKQFENKIYLSLASYNAGPNNVLRWLERKNCPKDEEIFIESIPFKETRQYVKRIINNIYEYKRIYPELEEGGQKEKNLVK